MSADGGGSEGAPPLEIGPEEAAARRADEGVPFVDVRERFELDHCHLAPDHWIPMDELRARWEEIPADAETVVYCHHGVRSLAAAKFLRSKGLGRVRSLAGGIDLWSRRIDASVRRY